MPATIEMLRRRAALICFAIGRFILGRRALGHLGSMLFVGFALLVALETPAMADDAVVILPTGGTTEAPVFDLVPSESESETGASGDFRARDQGRRQLVDPPLGPVAIRDLKVLPDGSHLLADVEGRGVAITDTDGTFRYTLGPPGDRPRISSASVSAYAAPGEPARLLVTDSNRSLALVVSPDRETPLWQQSFSMPGMPASFAQAIALPPGRIAFGVNWPSMQLSAVDLYESHSGQPTDIVRRLASSEHNDAPAETVVVPELADLRDLMGLPNGNLLVTTRHGLTEVTVDGDVVWAVDIGQTTELRGEFASATILPSGRVAVATFEPGVWTNPHTHHRVHWLSKSALEASSFEIVASTGALGFAPARLEVDGGHGGSGTIDYRPGLETSGGGALEDLALVGDLSINAETYRRGDRLWGSAQIQNDAEDAVSISRAAIMLTEGPCGESGADAVTLADLTALEIAAGDTADLQGQREVDAGFAPGQWCAAVHVQNAAGDSAQLGDGLAFDVAAGADDSGSTVVVRDLGHWSADGADVGIGADVGDAAEDPEPGCACSPIGRSHAGRSVGGSWLVLVAAGLFVALRRRVKSRRRP